MTDATQQPDPFSELRGLMERATPGPWYAAGGYVTRRHPEGSGFTASIFHLDEMGQAFPAAPFQAVPFARADDAKLICAAVNSLGALLDERDRLIGELRLAEQFIEQVGNDLHNRRCADWYPEGAHNAAEAMSEDMRLIGNDCMGFDARQALSQEIG